MTIQRLCKVCGGWHYIDAWPHNCLEPANMAKSDLPAPMVIRDEMSPLQGQHDGGIYTSKRALRQSYRDHGVTEVGNESPILEKPDNRPALRAEVKAAVQSAASYRRLTTPTETAKQTRTRERKFAREFESKGPLKYG